MTEVATPLPIARNHLSGHTIRSTDQRHSLFLDHQEDSVGPMGGRQRGMRLLLLLRRFVAGQDQQHWDQEDAMSLDVAITQSEKPRTTFFTMTSTLQALRQALGSQMHLLRTCWNSAFQIRALS